MRSVTQVLDHFCPPELARWYKNNSKAKCEQIAAETARVGKIVDERIQEEIRNPGVILLPHTDPAVLNCLKSWEQLKAEHPLFVPSVVEMQTELVMGDLVGHPDYVCKEDTGWGITDLKCTKSIRLKNWVQIAQYAAMLMILRGWNFPSFLRVIRLPQDGSPHEWFEVRNPAMIRYCMDLFSHYEEIYKGDFTMREFIRVQLEEEKS